jgi:hypothetical protein
MPIQIEKLTALLTIGLLAGMCTDLDAGGKRTRKFVRVGGSSAQTYRTSYSPGRSSQGCNNCGSSAGCNGSQCGCNGRKRAHSPLAVWLSCDKRGCTYSPDHGWDPPYKTAIRRTPVQYHRYWPARWYGEPGSAPVASQFPMVNTPTDTTQLGFYYQRVPQWRPNPRMIPPAPWPPQWHHRYSPPDRSCCPFGSRNCHSGSRNCENCSQAPVTYSTPAGPAPAVKEQKAPAPLPENRNETAAAWRDFRYTR